MAVLADGSWAEHHVPHPHTRSAHAISLQAVDINMGPLRKTIST